MIGAGHQLMTLDDFMVGKDDPIMVLLVSLKTNKTIFPLRRLTLIFMIISRLDQAPGNDLHASSGHNRNERQVRKKKGNDDHNDDHGLTSSRQFCH